MTPVPLATVKIAKQQLKIRSLNMARQEDTVLQLAKREMDDKKFKSVRDVIFVSTDSKLSLSRLHLRKLFIVRGVINTRDSSGSKLPFIAE